MVALSVTPMAAMTVQMKALWMEYLEADWKDGM
jgi:hypothetical protein